MLGCQGKALEKRIAHRDLQGGTGLLTSLSGMMVLAPAELAEILPGGLLPLKLGG